MRMRFVVLSLVMLLSYSPIVWSAEKHDDETHEEAEESATQAKKEATPAPSKEEAAQKTPEKTASNGAAPTTSNAAAKPAEKQAEAAAKPTNGGAKPAETTKAEAPVEEKTKPSEQKQPSGKKETGPSAILSPAVPAKEAKEEKKEESAAKSDSADAKAKAVPGKAASGDVAGQAKPELPASPNLAPVPEKKPESKSVHEEPQGEAEAINIDTLNLEEPRGNWLLKRRWWEESERLYEKIQAISIRIDDIKMAFYQQRSTLDREVFPHFYQNIGIGEGQLTQLLATLSSEVIDKHVLANKEKEDALERPLINRMKAEKENLERLQKMVKAVETYDVAMQEALLKLRDQVKIARRYETEAWETFKNIARELSDRKAYEHYYAVKGYLGSIKDIESYLKGAFGDYFNMLDGKIKQEIAQVQRLMADLQKRGVDLKRDAQALEDMLKKKKEEESTEEEEETVQEGSILSYITWPFVTAWAGIKSAFSSLISLFSNTSQEEEEETSEPEPTSAPKTKSNIKAPTPASNEK